MQFMNNPKLSLILVVGGTTFITYLEFQAAGSYYSIDALYCLPIIQAAHLGALRSKRSTDSYFTISAALLIAIIWSTVEMVIVWPNFPLIAYVFNIFSRALIFTVIGRVVTRLWKEREYAHKDALTKLGNRYEFFERMELEMGRSERSSSPYSLLFIDIDNFKKLNDSQGHNVGDQALVGLAEILTESTRRIDTVTRFGGDEFVILLPDTEGQFCNVLVNRIRASAESDFEAHGWPISLSIGQVTEVGRRRSIDEILLDADNEMYLDKKSKQ
ncbi:MAG: GGDEF domain-containing protein [Gallionella sp.]